MLGYIQNSFHTSPPSSEPTATSDTAMSFKCKHQLEKRISFLHHNEATPNRVEDEKAKQSLTEQLYSVSSPAITTEGPATSVRSWTHDKKACASDAPGVSSLIDVVEAKLLLSSSRRTSISRPGTPKQGATVAVPAAARSPYPISFELKKAPLLGTDNRGVTDLVAAIEAVNKGEHATDSQMLTKAGSTTSRYTGAGAANGSYDATKRLLDVRKSIDYPAFAVLGTSEGSNAKEASLNVPSLLHESVKHHGGCDCGTTAVCTDGPASSARCGGLSQNPGHYTQTCAMLISAERALAEAREEAAKREIVQDSLREALDRERARTQTFRTHHFEQIEEIRGEHAAQVEQLCEQIHVLKTVSEAAMSEKANADAEALQMRKDTLVMLEKERAEKRHIMADYREQTESLITEQGREITALRAALDQIKEQYDKLVAEHEVILDKRDLLEGQLKEAKALLDRERVDGAKRLREIQNHLMGEKEALQEEMSRMQENQLLESVKWQSKQQELLDQMRRAQERVASQEEEQNHALETLRQAHARELEAVCRELESSKELNRGQANEHRLQLEKVAQDEQKVSESLRQALEQACREKEEAMLNLYNQREQLQAQHCDEIEQFQVAVKAANKELAEECRARTDAEGAAEELRLRAESFQRAAQEASCALETLQAGQRAKERAVEELAAKLRAAAVDITHMQQQAQQEALEKHRLRDELAAMSTALESTKAEQRETVERAEADTARLSKTYLTREEEWGKELDQFRSSIKVLEEERQRLKKALNEAEIRLQVLSGEVEIDRTSLEGTNIQLRDTKMLLEDVRYVYIQEKQRNVGLMSANQELTQELQKYKLRCNELDNEVQMGAHRLDEVRNELQQQATAHENKLNELVQLHRAELTAHCHRAEQAHVESNRLRDAGAVKDAALQEVREELAKLRRDAALREGALQEELGGTNNEHAEALKRMDELLNTLRADLARSQSTCTEYQRELSSARRIAECRYSDLEGVLEQFEAACVRRQEDLKHRDQLNRELQGTVRLLTMRLCSHEEEIKRLQEELSDTNRRLHDAHTQIGRKDSTIGQINAKLRVHESRGGVL